MRWALFANLSAEPVWYVAKNNANENRTRLTSTQVGLASDSVFLRSAVGSGLAPSRSWGFYYGTNGDNETPGELVVGGYNSAKTSVLDFTNYTLFPNKAQPCPLQVTVESMKWGTKDLMAGQCV